MQGAMTGSAGSLGISKVFLAVVCTEGPSANGLLLRAATRQLFRTKWLEAEVNFAPLRNNEVFPERHQSTSPV